MYDKSFLQSYALRIKSNKACLLDFVWKWSLQPLILFFITQNSFIHLILQGEELAFSLLGLVPKSFSGFAIDRRILRQDFDGAKQS